jgi:hypothetical protein
MFLVEILFAIAHVILHCCCLIWTLTLPILVPIDIYYDPSGSFDIFGHQFKNLNHARRYEYEYKITINLIPLKS